jgi:23S rRNA pseudouridine1911/1915/1917 synthase
MTVHPGAGDYKDTLVNALLYHTDKLSDEGGEIRPGIVHRLDKNTSGLMVVAKNNAAHRGLARQIESRTLNRIYKALVGG